MGAQRLDGVAAADGILGAVEEQMAKLNAAGQRAPGLAVVLVGHDPASEVYVRRKAEKAKKLGFHDFLISLPATASTANVVDAVRQLAKNPQVDGLLVQLPLPPQVDASAVMAEIPPSKDVDGFLAANLGALVRGEAAWAACTPAGIMALLKHHGLSVAGKRALVLGRSVTVGKPIALLLLQADATVTIAHSRSLDLPSLTREAELLVVAIGKAGFIQPEHVRQGAIVVDVGIHRLPNGKLIGDVDPAVGDVAGWLSPVPGGVGATTIAALMATTMLAHAQHEGLPRPHLKGLF